MVHTISTSEQFGKLKGQSALLAYFSSKACSVCQVLKPKVKGMLEDKFQQMDMADVNMDDLPELAAENRVFTAPTIIVFFEGREYIRKSRAISLSELHLEIERIYKMVF